MTPPSGTPSPSGGVEALRRIRTFAQLFRYLIDELNWPLDADKLEEDEITYDWDPDAPVDVLKDLRRFQQMRPLVANQPWGVFFLEFAGPRLPITQVRRLLGKLVTKKRTTRNGSPRTWDRDSLLFVVITGADNDSMQLHLLAFGGPGSQSAKFLPLAWRPVQSPSRHLHRLATELLPKLAWPKNPNDDESWLSDWRQPFELPAGEPIKDAVRLAERMAKTARDLREQIGRALDDERGSGPFSTLMEGIRTQLISGVDISSFSDMCAQTLVYGVLTSRIINPEKFGSSPTFSTVPLANPFLEAFFEQIHDEAASLDLPGSGLPHLLADLRETNVEAILDHFDSTVKGGDPVIHFYEQFLKQYDRELRADAGAFYTPKPAVECMVRLVDEVLRSRFNLPMGIADNTSWQEVAERNGFAVPGDIDMDKPFVSMVDPATGTGTFLVEWLRRAQKSFFESSGETNNWPEYLHDWVLPAMHAFEMMLAPYAIAHLKLSLELHDFGVDNGKMKILLTNTLDYDNYENQLEIIKDPIAEEGKKAGVLKEKERFTVVIGNPPYDREQRINGNISKPKRKGGVVRYGVPSSNISPLIEAITQPMKDAKLGGHLKNIYNDYIYFWRWAVWQATELPKGPGVVAFITASSYLSGKSMGGVRHMLREAFDELWIIDLGGEGRAARTEQNIFDIRTPVAIAVGVSMGRSKNPNKCIIRYLRIEGTRSDKLARLSQITLSDIVDEVTNENLNNYEHSKNLEVLTPRSDSPYYSWPAITDLLPWAHSGCQAKRTWPIGETKRLLNQRWQTLLDEVPRYRVALLKETRDRKANSNLRPLLENEEDGTKLRSIYSLDYNGKYEGIERYGYRSFDRQWIIADNRLIDFPRPDLWRVRGPNQIYLTTLTSSKIGRGPALSVTPYVPDIDHFRGSGAKNVIPLFRDLAGQIPNITHNLLTQLSNKLGIIISAEDLLAYLYALGGTAAFSDRFNEELGEGGNPVRIPITSEQILFKRAVSLGSELLWWHTWGERFAHTFWNETHFQLGRVRQISPVNGLPEEFNHNSDDQLLIVGTGVFGPVTSEVWDFEVSGHKTLQSWIGYRMKVRRGRRSSRLDHIRPDGWYQTDELLQLLAILERTIEMTPDAVQLLDDIVAGKLILATDLPSPTVAERKLPKALYREPS